MSLIRWAGILTVGLMVILGGWTVVILTFAILSLIAAAIYFFFTKDPCVSMETDSIKPIS